MADRLDGKSGPLESGYLVNIAKSDTTDLPDTTRALIVPSAGDIKITQANGITDTFTVAAGTYAIRVRRVWSTGTTVTGALLGIV